MRGTWKTAGLVAAMVTLAPTPAAAAPAPPEREHLQFLDVRRLVAEHDVGEPSAQPRAGDVYVFDNLLRSPERADAVTRQPLGRFPSTCTVTQGTQARCEGTLELRDGTIDVAGTPDLAASAIDMVVTGGTGRYATATGSARLAPTDSAGISRLDVSLVRPAN